MEDITAKFNLKIDNDCTSFHRRRRFKKSRSAPSHKLGLKRKTSNLLGRFISFYDKTLSYIRMIVAQQT